MQKPLVTIENWAVVQRTLTLNYDELQSGRHLMGKVFRNTANRKAEYICTSPIVRFNDEGLVETQNTLYRLGKPSDGYKTWQQERRMATAA